MNVAARLEALAEPGGICVSRVVRDQVRDRLDYTFEDLGEQQVKNIARPARVYRVREATAAKSPSAAPPSALPLPDKPSIAVLPFANMSGDPEQDYFADGMVEEIITALSRIRFERLVDHAARRLRVDPIALRRRNLISSFPYRGGLGVTIDCGRFGANLEEMAQRIRDDGFAERRRAAAERGRLRGLGIACFLETSHGTPGERAEIRFEPDGRIALALGTQSNGQGHETSFSQIAAELLGLPIAAFRLVPCTLARSPLRDPLSEGFRHFVTSMPAPVASGWSESPGGPRTHWKAPPCHGAPPFQPLPNAAAEVSGGWFPVVRRHARPRRSRADTQSVLHKSLTGEPTPGLRSKSLTVRGALDGRSRCRPSISRAARICSPRSARDSGRATLCRCAAIARARTGAG